MLAPGKYTLRFVARENSEGKMGTFEMPLSVPDLTVGKSLRLSSMILSNQVQPVREITGVKNDKSLLALNPLIDASGMKLVPDVTRVFRPDQTLHVYLELYDPAKPQDPSSGMRGPSIGANVALYQGDRKVLETAPVHTLSVDAKRNNTIRLRFDVSMTSLQAGEYDCQVNVIDRLGHKFAFPRATVVVLRQTAGTADSAPGR